ncbi:MAG: NADH-ubiquinone oxidoreductase chain N [uncultured Chloroflexi bacterium]|uniref:NADH-quinone oxidoreductase subunit N n=1 Tax=uncultured Chloroflexota bacterium TaxID=166587 RepID=A0A6J4ILS2_9CHLR|nr:MAG: NADH-ubiquinone oxidoreductase chain N [uncultured Chloroflexota bacterium]
MTPFTIPTLDWWSIAPVLALTLTGCFVMLVDLFTPKRTNKSHLAAISIAGLAVTALLSVLSWDYVNNAAFGGMVIADNFTQFFNLLFVFITVVTVLLSQTQLEREDFHAGEFYSLLLFSAAGMMLMAGAADLIMVFLGIELLSISLYIMTGFSRYRLESEEASIKYLLLGSFATGFLLMGIALVYGATASTNLGCVAQSLGARSAFATDACPTIVAPFAGGRAPVILLAGMGMLLVGLGFKAAVAPFHLWTPDVYEGAPTAVTAYMSVAAKAAAFAAMVRVFLIAFPTLIADWSGMIAVIAGLTMIVGNTVAIAQTNIKRMLAYSSIAHAGYILVAVVAASEFGIQSVLFYSLAYTLMNLGAFAIVILLGRRGEENEQLADYAGLGYRQPALGALMAIFMLSLAGIPPTAGFVGKFYIFSSAIQAGQIPLAIVGVLASVVSVYFYLRVIYLMYMVEPTREYAAPLRARWAYGAAIVTAAGVIALGLYPIPLLDWAQASVGFVG